MVTWREDVLGDGFECADLDLEPDDEGPVVATIVRSTPPHRPFFERLFHGKRPLDDVDVLYVHGWSDYFFQTEVARFWTSRGARFYALDLRKYGRSLREGQTPGYIERLEDYFEEIGQALGVIGEESAEPRRLVLFGHSTGGLVLSLWASSNPGRADALVLNSPWLEFQLSTAGRYLVAPIVSLSARLNPREAGPQFDHGFYSRAQREVGPKDELARINELWRPDHANAVLSGWMRAILAGHDRVNRGLGITAPMAVLLSAKFALPLKWTEELTRVDTVLDVDEVAKASLRLGPSVTIERIDGALHDVFLSAEAARSEAFDRLDRWVTGWNAWNSGRVAADSGAEARDALGGPASPTS